MSLPPTTGPAAPAQISTHVPALDGARGLAVLMVLLDHASDARLYLFAGADLNRAGKYGVYLFFVLSAFLLTLPFCAGRAPTDLRSWLNYGLRRFLRIYPLYVVVLLAMIPMHKVKLADLSAHLLLRDGKNQFWSIPVEVKYYFLLPFVGLTLLFLRRQRWGRALAAALGAVGLGAAIFRGEQSWSLNETVLLSKNFPPFLIGSLAALAYAGLRARPAATRRFAVLFEAAAIMALGVIIIRIPPVHTAMFGSVVKKFSYDPAVCGVLWSVFIIGTLSGIGLLRGALAAAPLRYLGLISFSVYLWHRKFLSDVDNMPIPMQLRLVLFILVVCAAASVTYFLVERPLSRIRLRAWDAAPAPVPVV